MAFVTRLAALLIASMALCGPSIAQVRGTQNDSQPPSVLAERQIRERVNAGTVGLAGGLLEGAPIHFATDIARAVNDSGALTVPADVVADSTRESLAGEPVPCVVACSE